jgi:hypothetical protein
MCSDEFWHLVDFVLVNDPEIEAHMYDPAYGRRQAG